MVRVKPFRAYRPPPELAEDVAAPPYDVLDSNEARDIVRQKGEKGERCFLRVNKPEVDLPVHISPYDMQVYDAGSRNLRHFISRRWLVQDEVPCLYVYAQKMGEHIQYGICGGVPVEEYAMGAIKRHEKTQVKKENDRTRLTYVQNANVGPVFLMYRDSAEVDEVVAALTSEPPETSILADDGIHHYVWAVRDPRHLHTLARAFEAVPCSYIADGHHRSASAFRVGEMKIKEAIARGDTITGEEPFNFFLAVLFPAQQLRIMEYNRVVRDLHGFTEEQFLERVKVCYAIRPLGEGQRPEPECKGCVGMCLRGRWFELKALSGTYDANDPVKGLDVQVLYDNVLNPILGIGNPRTDERIKYVGGIRGCKELEMLVTEPNGWAVSFCMFPVSVDEVMAIADAEALMPPKATWFEPKLRSGLIIRLLDDA